jgi:hypothetical protein
MESLLSPRRVESRQVAGVRRAGLTFGSLGYSNIESPREGEIEGKGNEEAEKPISRNFQTSTHLTS